MPLTPYKEYVDPDTLKTLQAAFDACWVEVSPKLGLIEEEEARTVIARRLVTAAQDGERDPECLKLHALDWFKP